MPSISRRALGAAVLSTLALAVPASAAHAVKLTDRADGFRLTLNSAKQSGVLRLDRTYSGGEAIFFVSCGKGKRGKKHQLFAAGPVTPMKVLREGLHHWKSTQRWCKVENYKSGSDGKRHKLKVATLHLHRPR